VYANKILHGGLLDKCRILNVTIADIAEIRKGHLIFSSYVIIYYN